MDHYRRIEECTDQEPRLLTFLTALRAMYVDYLAGNVDDDAIADITIFWYVTSEAFSDAITSLDPRIKDLRGGMDFTHPEFSREKKEHLAKEFIQKIDEIARR